ncbi:YlmC/YmxH family sporulation protein [Peptococcaceae bacterium SCADC1_2_3]|nr:YlmC/YmxH family sporulation protein [Peptococcaceae bacterium SCADC1_2_3]KFI35731.1 YlmC/YmxH family sporulation protein [Peptococcaceae bacterium SCADC1_2_3]KFI37594.1 YlmC/YmxH family sporulation protein [Peptococcaceae bacterium SCADC1_2_3]HBQ28341.1 YlmC/YmxH family sporulation protein [Desulfotomaculum sp.]HCJ78771.1 YlmC/YmxH family sporulation protein [Desulfotomaculum sp.]
MRLSELVGKEIVNISNGARLGVVGESDLVFDENTGQVCSIILPRRSSLISFWAGKQHLVIPWEAIKKIGREVIIVELRQENDNFNYWEEEVVR